MALPADKVRPIEEYVLVGFLKKFTSVFGCICNYTNAYDKIHSINRLKGGQPMQYPYAFLSITGIQLGDTINSHRMGRVGMTTQEKGSSGNVVNKFKLVPVSIEVEITYKTNNLYGSPDSILSFASKWMMAYRFGHLKFDVLYGGNAYSIAPLLSEQLTIPQRENEVETESCYVLETTATIKGYMSTGEMLTAPVVNDINVSANIELPLNEGEVLVDRNFIEFPKK